VRQKRAVTWTFALVMAALVLSGCTGMQGEHAAPSATATAVSGTPPFASSLPTLPTATALPTAVPALEPAAATTAPQPTRALRFCCLRFATAVDAEPQSVFLAGTAEIVALWDYDSMQPADKIRRIWFRDNLIWLTREETWNWDSYGESGTVTDIAIYDNEGDGLQPAQYRLQLYVNDELQQEGAFSITPP
jgi:predicted small secreted protein